MYIKSFIGSSLSLLVINSVFSLSLAMGETQEAAEPKATTPVTPVVGMDPLRGVFGAQPGTYNFMSYDGTYIEGKTLDRIFATRDADREYFLSSVKKMNDGLESLLRYTLYYDPEGVEGSKGYPFASGKTLPGLVTLSQNAAGKSENFIPAAEFMAAVRRFKQELDVLTARIESLKSIKNAFPSQQAYEVGGKKVEIPSYGDLNMEEIAKVYTDRIEKAIQAAQQLRHKIELPNGTTYLTKEGQGLVVSSEIYFNPTELAKARKKRTELMIETAEERDTLTAYTQYSKNSIQTFINRFWDRYRLQQPDIKNERADQVEFLTRIFWTRSYLRATYGVRLGGIGIDYQEKSFNLDVILNSNKSLMNFYKETIWRDQDIQQGIKNYRNIVYRLQERTGNTLPPIENPNGIVDKTINATWYFGGNAAYVITFLAGNPNLAQAMNLVMRLCASDLYEEYVLSDLTTGQNKIIEMYKQRYKNTPEGKTKAEEWEDSFDTNIESSLSITKGSQQEAIRKTVDVLNNRTDRWQQAQNQLALLKEFEAQNEFVNRVLKDRKSKLRD